MKVLNQGQNSVTPYFSDLQDLWQELDLFLDGGPLCTDCSVKHRQAVEKERVFYFLAGLNRNLDEIRGRVVARDPFPSPEESFAEVRREEMHRKVMLTDDYSITASDASALAENKLPTHRERSNRRPWCDLCQHSSHTKEKC